MLFIKFLCLPILYIYIYIYIVFLLGIWIPFQNPIFFLFFVFLGGRLVFLLFSFFFFFFLQVNAIYYLDNTSFVLLIHIVKVRVHYILVNCHIVSVNWLIE